MNYRRLTFCAFVLLVVLGVLLSSSAWAQRNFLYTNDDQIPNTISAFAVGSNGTLTPIPGSPFATGGTGVLGFTWYGSSRISVATSRNLLFASNGGSNDVSAFTINPTTGVLTPVAGSPFATGDNETGGLAIAITADEKFLIAAANEYSYKVNVFWIAPGGELSPTPGSPFAALSRVDGIKVTPNGRFLAAGEPDLNQIEMFNIGSNGWLTSIGAFHGFRGNQGYSSPSISAVDIDCSTNFLYAGEGNSGNTVVDVYSIGRNGTLIPIPGSPFIPGVGSNSNVVLLSPDDKTLFVSNQFSSTVTVFNVEPTGGLSLVAGSPFATNHVLRDPSGMATSLDGKLLYVTGAADDSTGSAAAVSVFKVAADGTLSEVTGSPFSTGQGFGLFSMTAYPPKSCLLTVQIGIKPPAAAPVPINPRSKGKIPVAILSTLSFNAVTQVNTGSLTFGHTGNEASFAFCGAGGEDVNGDGLVDLVCHFNISRAALVPGDTRAFLKAQTVTGRKIQASEGIRTVPNKL